MVNKEWESVLNIRLSDKLREVGLNSRPEVIHSGNRRLDVKVTIGPVVVAVEAEHGQTSQKRAAAIGDADARLTQRLAQCAVALCYPENTTETTLPEAEVIWTVRDGIHDDGHWTSGTIEQLVSVIRLAPAQLGNPDYTAAALSAALDGAVLRLSESSKEDLARALDLPRKDAARNPWDAPAKRALLVIATAVMFHSRLDSHRNDLRPELDNRLNPPPPFAGPWPPAMAQHCAADPNPVGAFSDAWNLILALDYKPIFETGRAALLACPPNPAFTAAIRDTATAALAATGDIAGLRHDLLGLIFHTVLDTARYDGSFYTTTPAATLLAALAITETMCDWDDAEAIARLRIIDPACGTGTLLMAAAERIRDLTPNGRYDEVLAAALIERVLTGYDVNLTATHMAATTLGLLSPTTQFQRMKIGRTFLGVNADNRAYLGSLEFLDQQPRLMPWPNAIPTAAQVDSGAELAGGEPADLVIMNPPFTRSDLRHNQFTAVEEKRLKEREKRLFAKQPVHLSSQGNAFLALAQILDKRESGTIAAVLPLVTSTNVSALAMRRHLAANYQVETIVTSHDPERIYFSENTNIGEILLICRRRPANQGPKQSTQVVNLAINPDTPAEAFNLAHAISDETVAQRGYGTFQRWPAERIAAGDWGAVQFLDPNLSEQFVAL